MAARKNRLIIVLALLAVFVQTTSFSFLVYDDPINISKNPAITTPTLHQLVSLWKKPHQHLYIPVTYTAWMGIAYISNIFYGTLNPGLFHFTNILLHLANTLLVYEILVCLLNHFPGNNQRSTNIAALLAALIFALHPVQVEPICWATGLKDLLSAFFFFAATFTLLLFNFSKKEKSIHPVAVLCIVTGLYFLALLSKPQAVIFPLFIYMLVRVVMGTKPSPKLQAFLLLWVCMGLVIALLTKNAQPNPFQVSPIQRIYIATDAILFYLGKIVYPYPLLIDYGKTLALEVTQPLQWYYPLTAGLLTCTLYFSKYGKIVLACTALALICVAPVLGFMPFNFQRISIVADRYLYISVFAFALGLAILINKYPRPVTITISTLLIFGYGIFSFQYASQWYDTETLMRYTLARNPSSKIANQDIGVALMQRGKMRESIPYLTKAAELVPNDATTHFNLALSYACIGNMSAAEHEKKIVLLNEPKLWEKLSYILPRITNTCLKKEPAP